MFSNKNTLKNKLYYHLSDSCSNIYHYAFNKKLNLFILRRKPQYTLIKLTWLIKFASKSQHKTNQMEQLGIPWPNRGVAIIKVRSSINLNPRQ